MHHHLQRGKDTATLAALPEGFFAREKESHDRSCYSLVVVHYRPKPISFRPIQPTEESTHAAENCIQEQRAELFRPFLSSR
jgi:hypothetical protein